MTTSRHIVVTGAGGFIGSRLCERLLSDPTFAHDRFTLVDTRIDRCKDQRATVVEGDIADRSTLDACLGEQPDVLVHLAGILGGAAEANPALARRVNIEASLDLLERIANGARPPRLVFASSIAVFGPPLGPEIDDDTTPVATMLYGAQKRMIEVAVEQASARAQIDGVAVRLPGIVARPDADARLKSAFLNRLFHDVAAGRSIELPVSPDGASWLVSVPTCVDAFVHAMLLPRSVLGRRRAFTLPALRLRMDELAAALQRRFPDSLAQVSYRPDPDIEAQFARQPLLTTALADALGFRHDGDIDRLVARALQLPT